ncbi:MAG: STAS domain-containing protein [Saccharopolyspora sp.]|uniref:STAS domain-containing protein n=1 Tax=unclassified Saccharopolyspora TaxID=2646250 RepID=UPI0025FE257A|nr:STAS domain-containing protein [Saccharopolyspora sp.]MBQ6644666.1 STAS domain-containing protein [Saccharopolyspora sp.]
MTAFAPGAPDAPQRGSTEPATSADTSAGNGLALRVGCPSSTSIAIGIAGELDTTTAPRLHEILAPRLSSGAETVVLDLSELRFLGVAGLELLAHACRVADGRSMTVCIVDGPVCVERALRAAGWHRVVPTFGSVQAAVAEMTGRESAQPLP